MIVEAVVLTGGASQRMGQDKAGMLVEGEPSAARIARLLSARCSRVTILGREPIEGYEFLADEGEFAGPLVALSHFKPTADCVFIASCDLPLVNARLVDVSLSLIQGFDACLPVSGGHPQPLCGLYHATVWPIIDKLVGEGKSSMMALVEKIRYRTITAEGLEASGLDPRSVSGANTPEEWSRLTDE